MSDKLKQSISVVPEFVEGETPSPAKLNAMGAQLRRAAEEIEKAIGDIRGDSWPYSPASTTRLSPVWGKSRVVNTGLSGAIERSLDIANLGRLVGPASNLNPLMLAAGSITESIPIGVHEFSVRYPISGTINAANPDVSADPGLTTFVATTSALSAAGEYTCDSNGRIYCVTLTVGGNVIYTTDPALWAGGSNPQGAGFNVIPDPNQLSGGADIAITGPVSGVYTLTLPTCTSQQRDINGLSTVLDAEDINYLVQLELPEVIQNNFLTGEQIPEGFLYLKDYTSGKAYVDGIYAYNNASVLTVSNVDLAIPIAAGNQFVIITIGSDLTTAVDDLRQKGFHTHDRSFGEPFVALSGLSGILSAPGASGLFVPSENASNFAPQYLHRDGWRTGVDDTMNDENVMRGHFALGVLGGTAGAYAAAGETFRMVFGGDLAYNLSAAIFRDSGKALAFVGDSTNTGTYAHNFQTGPVRADGGYLGRYTNATLPSLGTLSSVTNEAARPNVVRGIWNVPSGTNDSITIDLGDILGAGDTAGIAHVNVAIQQSVASAVFMQQAQASTTTYEFNVTFNTTTDSVIITLQGPSWGSGNHEIRLVVWTY